MIQNESFTMSHRNDDEVNRFSHYQFREKKKNIRTRRPLGILKSHHVDGRASNPGKGHLGVVESDEIQTKQAVLHREKGGLQATTSAKLNDKLFFG